MHQRGATGRLITAVMEGFAIKIIWQESVVDVWFLGMGIQLQFRGYLYVRKVMEAYPIIRLGHDIPKFMESVPMLKHYPNAEWNRSNASQ